MKLSFLLSIMLIIGCSFGERLRPIDIETAMDNSLQRNADVMGQCFSYNLINGLKSCKFKGSIEIITPEFEITNSCIAPSNLDGNFVFGLDANTIPMVKMPLAIKHTYESYSFWLTYFPLLLIFLAGVFIKYIWAFVKWVFKNLVLKGTTVIAR